MVTYGIGMNENQNHLIAQGRTSSRVTTVPGGKSTVNLSWESPKTTKATDDETEKENLMKVIRLSAPTQTLKMNTVADAKTATVAVPSVSGKGTSSNAYAQGSRMNSGNVITDRPTSRVTQPPGGKSSISFY
eukprot:g12769.t1 g12769   contig7:78313-78820(+)